MINFPTRTKSTSHTCIRFGCMQRVHQPPTLSRSESLTSTHKQPVVQAIPLVSNELTYSLVTIQRYILSMNKINININVK